MWSTLTKCGCLFLEKSWELWFLHSKLLGSADQIVMLWPSMLWLMNILQFFKVIYKRPVPSMCFFFLFWPVIRSAWEVIKFTPAMCHIFRPLFYVPSHYPCRIFHQEQLLTHPSNLELLPLVRSEIEFHFCAKQKYCSQGLGKTTFFTEEEYYAGRLIRDWYREYQSWG